MTPWLHTLYQEPELDSIGGAETFPELLVEVSGDSPAGGAERVGLKQAVPSARETHTTVKRERAPCEASATGTQAIQVMDIPAKTNNLTDISQARVSLIRRVAWRGALLYRGSQKTPSTSPKS